MIIDDNNIIGHVIDSHDHDETHRVLEVLSNDAPRSCCFFYIPKTPEVVFGDIIQMNFKTQQFHVFKGNSRLSYKIIPQIFPGVLLFELLQEKMNQEGQK